MDLHDRVAIVTGATGGLGKVVTRDLAAAGARLGLLGTRIERLDALAAELALAPDQWHGQAADLTDPVATAFAVDAVVADFGRADILVHVVGGWSGGTSVTETPLDAYMSMLDQHFWTTLHVTRALVPHLAAGGRGRRGHGEVLRGGVLGSWGGRFARCAVRARLPAGVARESTKSRFVGCQGSSSPSSGDYVVSCTTNRSPSARIGCPAPRSRRGRPWHGRAARLRGAPGNTA